MPHQPIRVAVLGSTGSIGRSTLEVLTGLGEGWHAFALSAHRQASLLLAQAQDKRPRLIALTDPESEAAVDSSKLPQGTEMVRGCDALERIAAHPEVDIVVSAIVGSAGLRSTWAALDAGKRVALANKESLVVGGPLVTRLAAERGAPLLPVDSEHSAIFQAMQAGRRQEVRRVILTASGGPFRNYCRDELARVSVPDALAHPTWDMGPKITIDSATLMNKALEIIEARWLFDLAAEQISVVVHPQSIVHSMVEFTDGSVVAQLSPPDMRLPIQYALTWPERQPSVAAQMDWSKAAALQFEPPDFERFPALELGLEVTRIGGTAGAVINGANEAAVAAFLNGRLGFHEIVPACRSVLSHHNFDPSPSLEHLLAMDRWAREEVSRWVLV
ncbi:MAG: 1-deoxy-D-xylulose-5-phosphate reductoisomerase [Planctomycetota bacterium]